MKVYVSIKLRCAIAKFDTMLWGLMRRAFTLLQYYKGEGGVSRDPKFVLSNIWTAPNILRKIAHFGNTEQKMG